MSTAPTGWARQPPPDSSHATSAWTWVLTRPGDLTAARGQLRAASTGDQLPRAADDDVERLLLAFEELASNALRHGRAPVQVRVAACREGWLVDATDGDVDRSPVPAVDRDPALGGLGLHLIARLAALVGWEVVGARKHVWACVVPAG
ncbi:ATP-binding protein [Modestobacter versicolor]|uniref:ATP-binding protein n=1 Tax=Modestobacter versicolor TaxID=429133 RepID=UPI0034DEE7F2